MYDHQLSPRLGQRTPPETPMVRRAQGASSRPEAPHDGMIIHRTDLNALESFDVVTGQWTAIGVVDTEQLVLVGEVKMWLSDVVPLGYLVLDGSEQERDVFIELYALWSAVPGLLGPGDGSTTFNLPDMRSRLPLGAGTFAALGADDALSEDLRTPRHTHSPGTLAAASAGAHTHTIANQTLLDQQNTAVGGTAGRLEGSAPNITHNHGGNTGSNGAHTHTVSGATATSGASALPYIAVNFIVKF